MTEEITKEAIEAVEKEITEKEAKQQTDLEAKIEAEVARRLKEKEEAEKAEKEKQDKEQTEKQKEEDLIKKLAEHENKTKELEKQIEGIKMRKSLPVETSVEEKPVEWKDLPASEKIKHNKAYAKSVLGMDI